MAAAPSHGSPPTTGCPNARPGTHRSTWWVTPGTSWTSCTSGARRTRCRMSSSASSSRTYLPPWWTSSPARESGPGGGQGRMGRTVTPGTARRDLPALRRSFQADGFCVAPPVLPAALLDDAVAGDRKSTRLNSSHITISYAVFCLKKKKKNHHTFHSQKKKKKQK